MNEIQRRAGIWVGHMGGVNGEMSHASFVSKRDLGRWLSPYLITHAVDFEGHSEGVGNALQLQRLIDWPMRFVPVVNGDQFVRVVDKQALAEQIARLFIREQVSRTLSMTR